MRDETAKKIAELLGYGAPGDNDPRGFIDAIAQDYVSISVDPDGEEFEGACGWGRRGKDFVERLEALLENPDPQLLKDLCLEHRVSSNEVCTKRHGHIGTHSWDPEES